MSTTFADDFALKVIDIMQSVKQRQTFLNVDETKHFSLFHFFLILKYAIAGYGVRKLVPGFLTLTMLYFNFMISCICDGNFDDMIYNFSFFLATAASQFIFTHERIPFVFNSVSWYMTCKDSNFHFILDAYVVVTLLALIVSEYRKNVEEACLVIVSTFCFDWFSDQFIEGMDLWQSLSKLYFPVLLVTSIYNKRSLRLTFTAAMGFMWLFYKLVKAGYISGIILPFSSDDVEIYTDDNPEPFYFPFSAI